MARVYSGIPLWFIIVVVILLVLILAAVTGHFSL